MTRRPKPVAVAGAILLEALLSLALFVGAASFALTSLRSVIQAGDLAQRRLQAVDLARTRMAQLEAGLISLQDLRDESAGDEGVEMRDVSRESLTGEPRWFLEVETEPSEFAGLTLVTLTVLENPDHLAFVGSDLAAGFVLRQLVALGGSGTESSGQDSGLSSQEPAGPSAASSPSASRIAPQGAEETDP